MFSDGFALKFEPVMVTVEPIDPDEALSEVIVGGSSLISFTVTPKLLTSLRGGEPLSLTNTEIE